MKRVVIRVALAAALRRSPPRRHRRRRSTRSSRAACSTAAPTARSPASACRTRRATGPASTSISAARSRRRSSTIRPRSNSSRSPPRTASPRCSRARSTCWSRNTTWTLVARHLARPQLHRRQLLRRPGLHGAQDARSVNSALELNDASVCVQQGTTTELNLADYFRANKMKLKTVTFATADEAIKAYDAGRCDAYTTDASGLYRRAAAARQARRPHRAAGDHLQGAARPVGAPRRRPVVRHRASGRTTPCSPPRSSASPRPTSTSR